MKTVYPTDIITAITNARVFDGERVIDDQTVVIDGAYIQAVGGELPAGATVIDAHGASLYQELQLLVAAGLTPVEALRAATSTPARRFGSPIAAGSFPGRVPTCCWSMAIRPPTSAIRSPSAPCGASGASIRHMTAADVARSALRDLFVFSRVPVPTIL